MANKIYGRAGAIPREMSNTEAFHKGYQLAIKDVEKLECMKELRHITNTKEIQNIVDENEGNVSFDEIANEVQKDIDAQNQLRSHIKQQLQSLLKENI